jgi:hypothetical protein
VTRVFPVDYLLTGRTGAGSLMASTSTLGGGGGTGGATASSESQSTNTVVTEEKADFWGGLAEEIGALLSPGSGKVVVNRTSGTVTVTDYMANVEQVERHLRMIEARVRTGVVIETRIMEVTLDDSTKYGIDWTALPDFLPSFPAPRRRRDRVRAFPRVHDVPARRRRLEVQRVPDAQARRGT